MSNAITGINKGLQSRILVYLVWRTCFVPLVIKLECVSGLDIQFEQSENDNPARKKLVQVARCDESYTAFGGRSIQTFGTVVRRVTLGQATVTWVRFPQGAKTLHSAKQVVGLTLALYIAAQSMIFSLSNFLNCNLALTGFLSLHMNIRLPLFWSTWSWARGPDLASCADLARGQWV